MCCAMVLHFFPALLLVPEDLLVLEVLDLPEHIKKIEGSR